MMFIGLFLLMCLVLGFILLFSSFFASNQSTSKKALVISGGALIVLPLLFWTSDESSTKTNEKKLIGTYQFISIEQVDELVLEPSGRFLLQSECSAFEITGTWKIERWDSEFVIFDSDSIGVPPAEIMWRSYLDLELPQGFGCGEGIRMFTKVKN